MANSIEQQGIGHCLKVAAKEEWIFRNQPIDDIGIDAHMEKVDQLGKPLQLLGLQIKSGESWFTEQKDGNVIFRGINDRQYNYWTENSLPCIVVLFNPMNEICIWQKLTKETIEKTKNGKGKGYLVKVPLSQIFLDKSSNKKLLEFTNLPVHVTNYNFLLSQKKFMQVIQSGGTVELRSTEWVNKSSGKGDTVLVIDDGIKVREYEYPYWFPYTPYTLVFPKLFPWADFHANEGFFEEYDESDWKEYHCFFDKEDGVWLNVGDSFEEYREKLSPMRSINYSGEVAEYRMFLSLNALGKSFLKVEEFVSTPKVYVDARDSEK